jgi:hypothetical protein
MNRKTIICEHRDGYLGKWLTAAERIEFEAHLADCPDCCQVIQEQLLRDCLLARACTALKPVPPGLIDRIDRGLRRARRRRVFARTTGLAAAGILICLLATWFIVPGAPENRSKPSPALTKGTRPPEPPPDPRSLVQVTVENPSDVIAVPQKTDSPSVTVIWLYPTIRAAQEPNPAPSESFQRPERNGI